MSYLLMDRMLMLINEAHTHMTPIEPANWHQKGLESKKTLTSRIPTSVNDK